MFSRRTDFILHIPSLLSILFAPLVATGEITVLQNGVSPRESYVGCRDTWISDEAWERNRNQGASETLRVGGKRHALLIFDLSSIPGGDPIHRAVLRIANAGFPRKDSDGEYASAIRAYALARAWEESANWREHTRTDYEKADPGDWLEAGGDYDRQSDFGSGEPGLVATDTLHAGAWGHVHELDVTSVVRLWHRGTLPVHGLLLKASGHLQLASSEWPVPSHRPRLIIDHGRLPTGIASLPQVPEKIALDSVASTPDTGRARGESTSLTLHLSSGSSPGAEDAGECAYIKENEARFPGPWGWMQHARIGGPAGDFNRTLLRFNLDLIPCDASIRSAQLICRLVEPTSREVRNYRYGAFLLRLPDSRGWKEEEVTAAVRFADTPWPEGGVIASSGELPIAVGKVVQKEVTVRGQKRRVDSAIEFDITGAVRAWVTGQVPNCGLVLDNRIEGGAYDIYSSRAARFDLRPRLVITLSPAVEVKEPPAPPAPAAPAGDYWVEAMRRVHQRFGGRPGTLAQYGDSITVTMAYLASYGWAEKIDARNVPPEVRRQLDVVERYADLERWVKWKGGEWGNTGMMMSDWLLRNVDRWQRKMRPEAAVVMFGTNDIGRIRPPEYTENMAAALRRMMEDGTVPLLTSIPPAHRGGHREYWLAALSIARGLKVPLIDYQAEILRRRPDDWDGRLEKFSEYREMAYEVPTLISADGTHPSNPKAWQNDFGDEALSKNGYNLRNYMTLRAYAELIEKVLEEESAGGRVERAPPRSSGETDVKAAPEREEQDVPPPVSGLDVLHRRGQTFVTWKEVDPLITTESTTWGDIRRRLAEEKDAVRYCVYSHTEPIQPGSLQEAERIAEVGPLSGYNVNARNLEYLIGQAMVEPDEMGELARDYNGYLYTWGMESPRMDRYPVARFVVDEDAGPLPVGTGLLVHHPRTAGQRYYAVVSCLRGVENRRDFSPSNALVEPVSETTGPGEPVHQGPGLWGPYFDYPGQRQVYVQWCAPPLSPLPNMAFNWSVLVPPDLEKGASVPAELTLHSGNFSYAKPRRKYMRRSIQIAPHDDPFSGWYGFHEAYGTRERFDEGVVRNHTQKRIIAFLDWARKTFPIDPERIVLSGADGAALLALTYRDIFAYVLISGFEGRGKEYGRVLDPEQASLYVSAWGPRSARIRDEQGRAEWGWAMLDGLARERPAVSVPLFVCRGGSWGGRRGYGKAFGRFYTAMEEAHQPLIAGFGWDTQLITPDWYSGLWQPRRNLGTPELDITSATPIPAFANSSRSIEKLQSGNINWMHFWGEVRDTPEGFQITLGGRGTVDVTPRRLKNFKVKPGERLDWKTEPFAGPRREKPPPPRSGSTRADEHGLFTVKGVELPEGGLRLQVTRASG